ncbi:uncharacterized protein PADG_07186 [Paracoccidioides brasiliensis Pb18]|uniref:Uncharacterized protein n=1 Tax=Paracoccidioides brasiliensis (strain Pb18) TaxID=502780 RepID=C1GIV0_PARBD|nr:uncharacterized protein PADG_07186 [Paracoccidioides brasiliensis Pb18]EEH42366.2 hypothetical protein PADG_07186 [Paracoccidioides brasiliensis Pb18]
MNRSRSPTSKIPVRHRRGIVDYESTAIDGPHVRKAASQCVLTRQLAVPAALALTEECFHLRQNQQRGVRFFDPGDLLPGAGGKPDLLSSSRSPASPQITKTLFSVSPCFSTQKKVGDACFDVPQGSADRLSRFPSWGVSKKGNVRASRLLAIDAICTYADGSQRRFKWSGPYLDWERGCQGFMKRGSI